MALQRRQGNRAAHAVNRAAFQHTKTRRTPEPCVPACGVFFVYARACAGFSRRSAAAFPLLNSGRCACVNVHAARPNHVFLHAVCFFVYARALRGISVPQQECFSLAKQRTLRIAQALYPPVFPHTYAPRPPLRRFSASPSQKSCRRRTALLRQAGCQAVHAAAFRFSKSRRTNAAQSSLGNP